MWTCDEHMQFFSFSDHRYITFFYVNDMWNCCRDPFLFSESKKSHITHTLFQWWQYYLHECKWVRKKCIKSMWMFVKGVLFVYSIHFYILFHTKKNEPVSWKKNLFFCWSVWCMSVSVQVFPIKINWKLTKNHNFFLVVQFLFRKIKFEYMCAVHLAVQLQIEINYVHWKWKVL